MSSVSENWPTIAQYKLLNFLKIKNYGKQHITNCSIAIIDDLSKAKFIIINSNAF
tara:strand:- start:117 stop:281 length:165 start_codon:yes stop_codon:yes gene_type:complete